MNIVIYVDGENSKLETPFNPQKTKRILEKTLEGVAAQISARGEEIQSRSEEEDAQIVEGTLEVLNPSSARVEDGEIALEEE